VGLSTVLASAKTALDPQTGEDTPAALDASALTDALALPQGLASVLAPAAIPTQDASALPLPQGFASTLAPAVTRPVGMSTVLASAKTALDPQTAADTTAVLDANALPASALPASALPASALPAGPALPHLGPKTAAANALSALAPEAPKEVLAAPVFETASSRTEAPVAFSIAAQATETGSSAPTRGVPEPSASVQTRVGERAWDQAVGEKLVWMVNQKHQVAQLHLNPPELGPLKISISLDQNQASAQFFSAHASVREALETAMPRLREMLADSGITLGNASVGTEAFRDPAQQQPRAHVAQPGVVAVDSGMVSSGERLLRPMLGLVDTFA
jgi:flagellar hook-length control protein FliK